MSGSGDNEGAQQEAWQAIIDNYGEQHPLAAMLEISRARALHAAGDAVQASRSLALAAQRLQALGPVGTRPLEQVRQLEREWRL